MQKIKIRLPATLTDFGPGFRSLGIALSLYTNVEISPRDDEQLVVETDGEGAGYYAIGLRHPVVLAMIRVFQRLERAPLGFNVRVDNQIPLNSGLGAEAAMMAAGVIGANNLMGNIYSRPEMIAIASAASGQADSVVASILGGLTASTQVEEEIIYRSLPLTSFQMLVAVPTLDNYKPAALPERYTLHDVVHDARRIPLFLEAIRKGDLDLMVQVIEDRLHSPTLTGGISGFAHVAEVARLAGARAVVTSGDGPAMIFLTDSSYERIAEVIENAFRNLNTPAKIMPLTVDKQGVVISMMQSA